MAVMFAPAVTPTLPNTDAVLSVQTPGVDVPLMGANAVT